MRSSDNLDFENLSNSLFHEWNNFETSAITDDTKANTNSGQSTTSTATTSHRNRIELETIFVRVGLQMAAANRLADEVYNKLGLSADQNICFTDFISLIGQCHSESDVVSKARNKNANSDVTVVDEYTISPLNDHMIFDMHAQSSGLSLYSKSHSPSLTHTLKYTHTYTPLTILLDSLPVV